MNHIVVSGHSMGGQMMHRYAAVGKTRTQLGVEVPISYYLGNPSSSTWFSSSRPLSTGKCASAYDDWREGLAKYTSYGSAHSTSLAYNAALLAAGANAVLANWRSKTVAHGRGIRDRGDYSEGLCAPYTTGKDRHERFFKFIETWAPLCANPAGEGCHTVDYVNTTHNNVDMFRSPGGNARLFRDNFNGDGSKAYDTGYPRHQAGDDPYPNPALTGAALTDTDVTVYAGGKTHRGCYTDVDNAQSVAAFTVVGYTGSLNTRTYCANVCTTQGYTIAGLRDSNCYCGNSLGSQSVRMVTSSCENKCPGDASFCGSSTRVTVLSSVTI
ncbi:hypothetical protein BKA67DRAFT_345110 [Truncatella angustata]|uniref:WSC domain-containing protein n=1 Tax=Truncatella angustata TaxID=152316 RepID=A0A9P8ZVI4_9PEZI|nr:uncharacterized protein BKA67DRAFT_345110 [Truncatella angustata]KAH6652050.1 hypothetical protein BKA67DRAFT_345110 [Truncatella angustata]